MKKAVHTMAAAAAVLLIAACGGGGGGGGSSFSLQVSGTAATGAALSGAAVEVKCAAGSGTATTTSTGSYTVTMDGGALPCIIKVSGTAGALAVTLHSVAEAGSASGSRTSAVANVTPITEMIVAQLVAALPADGFADFNPGLVTAAGVANAASAIVAALQTAGIDLAGIDPLKATLVPATDSTAGNAYDVLLDVLGDKIGPASLPLVVSQIAAAAVTQSSAGLAEAMAAVAGGALEHCPTALSGKYRTLDLFGKLVTRDVDFSTKTFSAANGSDQFAIATDAAKPCEFTVTGSSEGRSVVWNVVIGAQGAGAYKARFTNPDSTGTDGYIFPAQARTLAEVAGTWSWVESGHYAPVNNLVHFAGQLTVGSDGSATTCDYDTSTWACDTRPVAQSLVARSDGGFDLKEAGTTVAQLYGYRTPGGAIAVFGTTNASGASGIAVTQTSLVATRPATLPLPQVGTVTPYWDTSVTQIDSSRIVQPPLPDASTILTVDAATQTVTRRRSSDDRPDTLHFNTPLAGVRTRDAGTWKGVGFAQVFQFPLQGTGITLSVNTSEFDADTAFIHNISVLRP